MYTRTSPRSTMATQVIRSNSGTQPPSHRVGGSEPTDSPLSSASSTGSHRNKKLLKSYHDFTMQLFSSSQVHGETDTVFLAAVRSGELERVENMLRRRNHEVINIDARDRDTGDTALMWAVRNRHVKIIHLLLKYGADVTLRNASNHTVLELTNDYEIRRILLESVLRNGVSPRHLLQAAWQGNIDVVKHLLGESKILDINCRNADGFTPLLLVTRDVELFESIGTALETYDPVAVLGELLRHRGDPIATDRDGHSPLHHAASSRSHLADEMALSLMKIPSTKEVRDSRSQAPIHVASHSGSVDVVVALLGRGVDVNTRGYAGATPLHVSASAGQTQVANTLLHHGADVTLVDDSGNTAVDVAKSKRMKNVLREAWTDATEKKQESVLSPVKPPSRMDSNDEISPRQTRVQSLTGISPPGNDMFGKRMMEKFEDAQKVVQAEEQMLRDIESGRFTPGIQSRKLGLLRSHSRNSPTPAPPKTPRVLDPLSSTSKVKGQQEVNQGSKRVRRSISYSGRAGSASKGQKLKVEKTKSDPTAHRLPTEVAQIPVTIVGLDLDDSLRDVRFQRILSQGVNPVPLDRRTSTQSDSSIHRPAGHVSHHRLSDPSLTDVAKVYREFCNKDLETSPALAQVQPLRMSQLLNLEQMHLRMNSPSPNPEGASLFPTSRTILPHSPSIFADNRQRQETIFEFENEESEMSENREREMRKENAEDLRLNLSELDTRGQPAIHQRVMFNIEESRVNPLKDSSDSGQGSSRSTLSHASSTASILTSSPSPHLELDRKDTAKNRLGIKMTPSATKLPDERIVLFHRAQMRLPSLGHASPTPKPQSAQRTKLKTSEDCLSVLSMSSVHAVMMSDGSKHDEGDTPAFARDLDADSPLQQNQAKGMNSKRKISLEDNAPLLQSRRRSSSTISLQDTVRKGLPVDLSPRTKVESLKMDCSPAPTDKTMGVSQTSSRKRNSPSQEQAAIVEPLSATPAKVVPMDSSRRLTTNRNQPAHPAAGTEMLNIANKNSKKTPRRDYSPSRTKGAGPSKGDQKDKGGVRGPPKRPIGTFEVLPVAKVTNVKSAEKGLQGEAKSVVDEVKTSKPGASVGKIQSVSTEQDLSSSSEMKSARTPVRTNDKEAHATATKESTSKKSASVQSKAGNQRSKVQTGYTGSCRGVSTKVSSQSVESSQTPKATNKKNSKQVKGMSVSKPAKEASSKPSGKSAIKDSAVTAAKKRNENMSKQQGKTKTDDNKKEKNEAVMRQTSWKISCDDDDSSESDFENGEVRFAIETPVKAAGTSKKKQKCGKKATPLPVATKMDDLEDLMESSDAEDVFEEVIFSEGEEMETSIKKGKSTQRKDSKKVLTKEMKSAPEQMRTPQKKLQTGVATGEVKKLSVVAQQKGTSKNNDSKEKQGNPKRVPLNVNESRKGDKPKEVVRIAPSKSNGGVRGRDNEATKQKPVVNSRITADDKVKVKTDKKLTPRTMPVKPINDTAKEVKTDKKLTPRTVPVNPSNDAVIEVKTDKKLTPRSMPVKESDDTAKEKEIRGKLTPRVAPSKISSRGLGDVKSPRHDSKERKETSAASRDVGVKEKNKISPSSSNVMKDIQQNVQDDRSTDVVTEPPSDGKQNAIVPSSSTNDSPEDSVAMVEQRSKHDERHIDPAVKVTTSEQIDQVKSQRGSQKSSKSASASGKQEKRKSLEVTSDSPSGSKDGNQDKKGTGDPMAAKEGLVITDMLEMFKLATTGSSTDMKLEVLGKIKGKSPSIIEPVKRLMKGGQRKSSAPASSKAPKGKTKERIGSGGKSKGRVGSGGSKGSEGSKKGGKKMKKTGVKGKGKKKMKDADFNLVPDSEKDTTAFITGHGWSIKTSRNENDDVIIVRDNGEDSSTDEDNRDAPMLADVHLSPHNSLKLDELTRLRPLSIEDKKNIANILSPLEMHAPMFIPDTMDTIKEFVDSLKSTSSEMSDRQVNLNLNNLQFDGVNDGGRASHGQKLEEVANDQNKLQESAAVHGKGDEVRSDERNIPDVRVRASSVPSEDTSGMTNQGDEDFKLGVTDGISTCSTNPELLKVFRIKDHFETQSPRDSRKASLTSEADDEQVREHLSLILSRQQDSGSDANEDTPATKDKRVSGSVGTGQQIQSGKESPLKESILKKKPPLPKKIHQHQIQSSKRSPRRSSEPATPSVHKPESVDDALPPVVSDRKSRRTKEVNNSQVSSIKNFLPDKKFSPPTSTTSKRRGQSLGDLPREGSSIEESPSAVKDNAWSEADSIPEQISDEDLEESEGEDPLAKHVQTITEKTLQEFSSAIANSQDTTNTSILLSRPVSRSTQRSGTAVGELSEAITTHGGEAEEADFLNQSLALSEASSEVFRDLNDTGESVGHAASMSSSMVGSTERSLSVNTNASESEGTELLHWKKGNLLGKGAFGTVYCGLTNTGQLLAVKKVELSERDKNKAKQQYQKLQEEVQLLKTLRHKNIVGFLGVSLEDNTVNIFMQFIPGGSIASLLARFGSLDEPVFCRYTRQILEGTQYLHENSVIHRDIKGANIMLMSNGVIKLIDFGCAKRLCIQLSQSQNVLKSMRGTPYWMAPEVIMETGHGKKSDIWSIGCTVFEMATRKPPWADMPPMAAIFAIGSGDPVPQMPDRFSEDARNFVNACLAREQSKRCTATELLKHPFIRRRRERGREQRLQTRISSSTSIEEGPIVFREQPISRDSSDSRKRNYAPDDFR